MRSPTTFLNRSEVVPSDANPGAKPVWQKVSDGNGFAWHDHRIVWTGAAEPPIVEQAPDVSHLIFRWSLPATAGGKPFRIKGFLGWAPPPKPPDSGRSAWVYAAAPRGRRARGCGRARSRREGPPREAAGPLAQEAATASRPGS